MDYKSLEALKAQAQTEQPQAQAQAPEASSSWEDYAKLALGMGARVVAPVIGGAIGALGGVAAPATIPLGAGAASALTEALLERYLEPQHKVNLGRVGVAGGLGAIPGSWLVRGGRPILSAAIGGGLGYGSTVANKVAEGDTVAHAADPRNLSGMDYFGIGAGAATGGLLGKFHGAPKKAPAGPKVPPPVVQDPQVRVEDGKKVFTVPKPGTYTSHPTSATPDAVVTVRSPYKADPHPSDSVQYTIGNDAISVAKEKVKPLIKAVKDNVKSSLGQGIADTRPTTGSLSEEALKAREASPTVPEVFSSDKPGSRFVVADPTHADVSEQPSYDSRGNLVGTERLTGTTALPEPPSEATLAALGRPANKRMSTTQLSQERSGAKSAQTKEVAADLQATKADATAVAKAEKDEIAAREAAEKAAANRPKSLAKIVGQKKKELESQWNRANKNLDARNAAANSLEAQGEIEAAKAGKDKSVIVRRVVKDENGQSKVETWKPAELDESGGGGDSNVDPDAPDPWPTEAPSWATMSKAKAWIDQNGGPDVWEMPTRDPNSSILRSKRISSDFAGDIVGDRQAAAAPTPNAEDALVNPAGRAKNAAQALRRARPFAQLSKEEQQGLVPYIQDAIDRGYKGNIDDIADELAHQYGAVKEGHEAAKSVGADSDELVRFIRKKGGLNISKEGGGGYKGDLEKLRDHFKGTLGVRSGKGLINSKTGKSIDGMLELLKQDPSMFPQIKDRNDFKGLVEALYKAAGEPHGTSVLDKFDAPSNWWHKFQPEGEPIPGLTPDVELTDYTENPNPSNLPETVDVAPPASNSPSEPNLPEVSGPGGGTPKPLTDVPFGLTPPPTGKGAAPKTGSLFEGQPVEPPKGPVELPAPTVPDEEMPQWFSDRVEELAKEESQEPRPGRGSRAKPSWAKRAKGQGGGVDPALLAKIGSTGVGAAVGATQTPDDPLKGAMLGGALGLAAPTAALAAIKAFSHNPNATAAQGQLLGQKVKDVITEFGHMIPDIQRFNLLMDNVNLPINVYVGPWGSAVMGALEHAVQGDARGLKALKILFNPKRFVPEVWNSRGEASLRIAEANERTEGVMGKAGPEWFKELMAKPARAMTAGDITARNILLEAGFTPEEARRITLTSDPQTAIGKKTANWKKTKSDTNDTDPTAVFADLMLPFYRTGTNQLEQGMQRIPGLGFILRAGKDKNDPLVAKIAQQAMGGSVGAVAFMIGTQMPNEDPNNPVQRGLRKTINEITGQYGTIASVSFMAGQAYAKKRTLKAIPGAVARRLVQGDIPLPTPQPIQDAASVATRVMEGHPFTDRRGHLRLPGGVIPGFADPGKAGSIAQIALKLASPNTPTGRPTSGAARPTTYRSLDALTSSLPRPEKP